MKDTRICTHKTTYEREIRNRKDIGIQEIIRATRLYRDSKRADYRFWHRLAVAEAKRRGLS